MEEDIRFWVTAAAIIPALVAAFSGLSQFGRDRRREGRIKRDLELLALIPDKSVAAEPFLRSIEIAVAERTAERLVPFPLSSVIPSIGFVAYGIFLPVAAFAAPDLRSALILIVLGMFCLAGGGLLLTYERSRVKKYRARQRRAIMLGRNSARTRINLESPSLRVMLGENKVVPARRRKRPEKNPSA